MTADPRVLGIWLTRPDVRQVLSWIDICAGLAAKSVAGGPCVTASVDAVHFLRPVRVGSVAIVAAMVNRTFNSSMEVRPLMHRQQHKPMSCDGWHPVFECLAIYVLVRGTRLLMALRSTRPGLQSTAAANTGTMLIACGSCWLACITRSVSMLLRWFGNGLL